MDVRQLSDFIWTRDNVLDKEYCDHLIQKFESDDRKKPGATGKYGHVNKDRKDSTDLPMIHAEWKDEDKVFFNSLSDNLNHYFEVIGEIHHDMIPNSEEENLSDYGFLMKRYEPDGYYHWHHDYMTDNNLGTRLLTAIWYLNDVSMQGCTEFIDGTKVQPKTGRLVIFPASWMYLHRGCCPQDQRKYIVSSWFYHKSKQS